MFVLVRDSDGSKYDGYYTAMPGSTHSYTKNLENAQTFSTREQADANKCGNETAVPVSSIMQRPR